MHKLYLSMLLVMVSLVVKAQGELAKPKVRPITTVPCTAEVISIFEYSDRFALLKISEIDTLNPLNLSKGDELLAEFYFSTKAIEGSTKMRGINAGDSISVRIAAKEEAATGQMKYTAFDYSVMESKADVKVPSDDEPHE